MKKLSMIIGIWLVLVYAGSAAAMTFSPLKEPECITDVTGMFTTNGDGVQYPQSGSGINPGYVMNTRWQGPDAVNNRVRGDSLSRFTGFSFEKTLKPPPVVMQKFYQRGQQPGGEYMPSGVQLYCNGGGMFINTWSIKHREVIGGGINDWFGYTWEDKDAPLAFYALDSNGIEQETSLVIQANIAVAFFDIHHVNPTKNRPPCTQIALLLAIDDVTHPELPPIVLVTATHDACPAQIVSNPHGWVSHDFTPKQDPAGKGGVPFSGAYITNDPYRTLVYTGSLTQKLEPKDDRNAVADFFRIHHTPANMRALIAAINSGNGPFTGYSTDLRNYRARHGGIIMESLTFDKSHDGSLGDDTRDQVATGMNFYNLGLYRVFE